MPGYFPGNATVEMIASMWQKMLGEEIHTLLLCLPQSPVLLFIRAPLIDAETLALAVLQGMCYLTLRVAWLPAAGEKCGLEGKTG